MWKTIVRKDSKGKKNIQYRLFCNRCKKVYKEYSQVVPFDNPINDDCYFNNGWYLHNGMAVCPRCQDAIDADIYDDDYNPKLDIKNWKTWIKRNNPELVVKSNKNDSFFYNVVLPTMKKYGFKLYNEDSDYLAENDKPRDVAIRAIYRGGNLDKKVPIEAIEFVYYLTENKHECPYIDIFWRKA
jgi:hypothetical protein